MAAKNSLVNSHRSVEKRTNKVEKRSYKKYRGQGK
jgi:hypothetical protein